MPHPNDRVLRSRILCLAAEARRASEVPASAPVPPWRLSRRHALTVVLVAVAVALHWPRR